MAMIKLTPSFCITIEAEESLCNRLSGLATKVGGNPQPTSYRLSENVYQQIFSFKTQNDATEFVAMLPIHFRGENVHFQLNNK